MFLVQLECVAELKEQFANAGRGLSYRDLGVEGRLNKEATNIDQRLATLQMAVIAQSILLSRSSLDQISVCFEIIKHLQFFGHEVFQNPDVYNAERNAAGFVLEKNVVMVTEDVQTGEAAIDAHAKCLEEGDDDAMLRRMLETTHSYTAELDRFDDVRANIVFFMGRDRLGLSLYDEDQEPNLKGKSPQRALTELYRTTVTNTERAVSQHIQYATTLLSRIQFIQSRVIPAMPGLTAEWEDEAYKSYAQVQSLIKRIDVLADIHKERSSCRLLQFV